MPVGGEILELNPVLEDSPDVINKDPYGQGWIIKISISNPSEVNALLSPEKYATLAGV
jgi:glycine cleavage system H protein